MGQWIAAARLPYQQAATRIGSQCAEVCGQLRDKDQRHTLGIAPQCHTAQPRPAAAGLQHGQVAMARRAEYLGGMGHRGLVDRIEQVFTRTEIHRVYWSVECTGESA